MQKSSTGIGKNLLVRQNYSMHIVRMESNDLKRSDSRILFQITRFTGKKSSYEHEGQVILSPLHPLQKRLRQLKQRKSKTLTGVVQVEFPHTSVAGSLDSGMLDQNALVAADSAFTGFAGWELMACVA